MKTNSKIFGRSNVSQEISINNRTARGKEKGGINMFNKAKMSPATQRIEKGGKEMKTAVKGKLRFFKEVASFASNSFKAGWNGEEFDANAFVEERGFDTLLTKEEREAKAGKDASKAAKKKEEERKAFLDSIGEASEPKKSEVETPVKEEESDVKETTVDETTEKEETPEVTENVEVTEEEAPEVDKVRPILMKVDKLFNHVGKFGSEGIRRVKGGYQRVKGKVLGLAAKSSFKHNISKNAKMLGTGVLAMYSGLALGIQSVYIFGLLTMILALRVVLPVVLILGLIEVQVMFAEKNREEGANA